MGLIVVVAILAFTLFGSAILSLSFQNGMASMKERLGADLMVVPGGYEADVEAVLVTGKQSYFYFDSSIARNIEQVEGVSQITSQFFLTSLAASCCSTPVQLIGYDAATDFVIRPWIAEQYDKGVCEGQIVVGSDVSIEKGNIIRLYNQEYPVVAQLAKTATGLDSAVFMNMDTMQSLLDTSHEDGYQFLSDNAGKEPVSRAFL